MELQNSLTKKLTPISPSPGRKTLYWYVCGPTVYDHPHLGHARTYLSLDLIRRVATEYFNQEICLIMNITNIDDKIINRARQEKRHFQELADEYEASFFRSLETLNIRPPDILTRVSEYIPEMISFIETLINQGFAYPTPSGSVYFDLNAYQAKIGTNQVPFRPIEQEEAQVSEHRSEKQNQADFALWKACTQPDEPGWTAPWSEHPGRPGWHLECSTMSIDVVKQLNGTGQLDLHAGGIDLEFPHHQNEVLQSEAYFHQHAAASESSYQWCQHFLHFGHLDIGGLKMSKSLKNFITIESGLLKYSSDALRMLFLLSKYNAPLNFDPETSMEYAENILSRFINFFKFLDNYFLARPETSKPQRFQLTETDQKFLQLYQHTRHEVDQALAQDFNTPLALTKLQELIDAVFTELNRKEVSQLSHQIVKQISEWIFRLYHIFGFSLSTSALGGVSNEKNSSETKALNEKLIKALVEVRNEIRQTAKEKKDAALFKLSDRIRDHHLQELGIKLQDLNI